MYGSEMLSEHAFELYGPNTYAEEWEELSMLNDYQLLDRCIKEGEALDNFKPFPAYSIAQKIINHNWRLTKKQRTAMLNCLAYYLTEQERED